MLESFLAVVDRLINLVERRIRSRRELFESVISPLFHELEGVVTVYYEALLDSRVMAEEADRTALKDALAGLKTVSVKIWVAAQKVDELAKVVARDLHDKPTLEFLERVTIFLKNTDVHLVPVANMSRHADHTESFWHYFERKSPEKAQVLAFLDIAKTVLAQDWTAVAQIYARLQLHLVRKG